MAKKVKKVEYNRIKQVMDEQKMSVSMLGYYINRSRVVVSNYIHNNKQPSLPVLFKIAEVLKVSPKDLINE